MGAQAAIENAVLQVAKQMEADVDAKINKLETMDEDDLERLRARRLEHMKRQADKRQEWLSRGHGAVSGGALGVLTVVVGPIHSPASRC